MARLFADENSPLPVVEELRRLGHDVLTVQEVGMANQMVPDKSVLDFGTADNRIVLTLNRKHFVHLHRRSSEHEGIIVCTVDLDFAGQALRIHEAVGSQESLPGELIRVNRPRQGGEVIPKRS